MPARFIRMGRYEPEKAIYYTIVVVTGIAQLFVMSPWYGPPEVTIFGVQPDHPWWADILGALPVFLLCVYCFWALYTGNIKHMTWGAFALSMVWLFSALSRAFISQYPFQILWVPMLIVALVLSILYLHLAMLKRTGATLLRNSSEIVLPLKPKP